MAKGPKTGMFGIWSSVSRQFVFGIQEPTRSRAIRKIIKKIGKDWLKYRFDVRAVHESHASMFWNGLKYKEPDEK